MPRRRHGNFEGLYTGTAELDGRRLLRGRARQQRGVVEVNFTFDRLEDERGDPIDEEP